MSIKRSKGEIDQYQKQILSLQQNMSVVDNAAFIEEMKSVMTKVENALSICAAYLLLNYPNLVEMLMKCKS